MSAPDPEGMSLLAKAAAAGAPIAAAVWGFVKLWNKKADKHTVANQLQDVKSEQALQRSYFKDVFNKLEEHARRDEDHFTRIEQKSEERHRELLMYLVQQKKE